MVTLFTTTSRLLHGLSYWRVKLSTGKTITEGQVSFDFLRGTRNVDWHLDIVGSGDCKHIRELTLCTLEGDATLQITEPYTAFQLNLGTQTFLTSSQKIRQAQIIGRVDDKETGACTAVIWDILEQKLYVDHQTTVKDFAAWREEVPRLGKLSYDVMGLRGISL